MDTCTAAGVARSANTSTPRVVRTAKRLGFAAQPSGRMAFTPSQVERLKRELGYAPSVPGLSTTQVKALAALARAPFGLSSVRAVAGQAGISPTAASKALLLLEREDLVRREATVIAAGHARNVRMLLANRRAERWLEIAPALASVAPPARQREPALAVPPRLRHLFWNTAPAQLNLTSNGPYIAHRIISTMDLDGLAWGASHLRSADWKQAADARGLDAGARALAHNLARGEGG
jgi:DNA-binding MarR family transcriptional regulator